MPKTYDQLAAELRKLGLDSMADEAAKGMYHDFLSPYPLPEMRLVRDLMLEHTKYGDDEAKRVAIMALRRRVADGEFDASKEESDEWAASPEGQETFRKLVEE